MQICDQGVTVQRWNMGESESWKGMHIRWHTWLIEKSKVEGSPERTSLVNTNIFSTCVWILFLIVPLGAVTWNLILLLVSLLILFSLFFSSLRSLIAATRNKCMVVNSEKATWCQQLASRRVWEMNWLYMRVPWHWPTHKEGSPVCSYQEHWWLLSWSQSADNTLPLSFLVLDTTTKAMQVREQLFKLSSGNVFQCAEAQKPG
jgi:hypothetical protein